MRIRDLVACLVLVSTGATDGIAQSDAALASRLDSIAGADVGARRAVGLAVAVVRGDEPLLLEAYGSADADGAVAMTTKTVIPIGSVTKQFTAVAILQLRDAGLLDLDDAMTKWLPEFETRAPGVTLRHLLHHTAGIMELPRMPEIRAMRLLMNPDVTRDSVYGIISRYPPQFPPGAMQVYSNTGYWLLGRVVEKASGMAYERYVEEKIFGPLGMTRSAYCGDRKDVADRAYGHGMRNGVSGRAPEIVHTATFAAGAICSTAGDMVTWLQALHGGRVLSPRSYAEMIEPSKLIDGTSLRYGMGLVVWTDTRGLRQIGHGGGGFGFSSQAWWHPAARLAVVVLTNSEPDNTTEIAEALTAAVLPAGSGTAPFPGDASPLTGTYTTSIGGTETVITVTASPDGLTAGINGAAPVPLRWVDGLTFGAGLSQLTFIRAATDRPASELHYDTGGDHLILRRQ